MPDTILPLPWKPREDHPELFFDGDQYLVALQCGRDGGPHYWEYSVVRIYCDEDYFQVDCNDEPWGWQWEDVEFYIRLSEFQLPAENQQRIERLEALVRQIGYCEEPTYLEERIKAAEKCGCAACNPTTGLGRTRMIVCDLCGSKRCPHATDHRHLCTNSNQPGQAGSSYCVGPIRQAD